MSLYEHSLVILIGFIVANLVKDVEPTVIVRHVLNRRCCYRTFHSTGGFVCNSLTCGAWRNDLECQQTPIVPNTPAVTDVASVVCHKVLGVRLFIA